jgi:predicted transcriptional regulator
MDAPACPLLAALLQPPAPAASPPPPPPPPESLYQNAGGYLAHGATSSSGGGAVAGPAPAPDLAAMLASTGLGQPVSDRFVVPPSTIRLGKPGAAAHGLADLMGIGDAHVSAYLADPEGAIRREFAESGSQADQENLRQILEGTLDDGKTLAALVEHPHAKTARLKRHHVLALRMYTTQSYGRINDPLRQDPPMQPHPFAATTYFISEGIKKLRAVAAERPDAHQVHGHRLSSAAAGFLTTNVWTTTTIMVVGGLTCRVYTTVLS